MFDTFRKEYRGFIIQAQPYKGCWRFLVNGIPSVRWDFPEPYSAIEEAEALIDFDPSLFT